MEYSIRKDCRDDSALRQSFNALAQKTFGLNFESWYQHGFWNGDYIPYVLTLDGEAAANVSVNRMRCLLDGQERNYIQLGTVMTRQDCRGRGYSRLLMEEVLRENRNCDGIFLFANDTVLDFYPKFGFRQTQEFRFRREIAGAFCQAVPIPMETREDWMRFLKEKNRRMDAGVPQMGTNDLLMFYLTQFMERDVFYLPPWDAYAVAELRDGVLTLYALYTAADADLSAVCAAFGSSVRRAELAFTPGNPDGFERHLYRESDTVFFLQGTTLAQDMERILSFPTLAHA
jgi:GNAT superfamily N-acetyltransferase